MTAKYHSFITGLASLLLVFCTNNDSVQAEESVDILSPAAFAEPHETVFSASTLDPVSLHRGQVLETATDISLSTPVSELTYTRTYSSRLINDKDAAASLNGANWFGGLAGRYITPFEGGVRIRWDASSSRLFNERDGKFVPRGNFNASLQKRGEAAQEEYVMIQKDTDIVYVFYGFNNTIAEKVRGKIKEKTTRPLFVQGKKGDCFHYSEDGLLDHIITAAPQNDRIQYLYLKQENQSHLKQIDVFDGPTDTDAKIASAEYLYFEELANAHEDIGTAGDLVQIKTATLLDDKKSWKTQTVQYRYHRTDKKNDTLEGGNHQLKMVLETDAIARILDWNEGLKTPEFILEKGDNEILPGGLSLMYYASRAFSYYTEATHTNIPLQTVWAEENLTEQYGNPAISRPVPKGHVKTEMIRSGCATCGGSSASGGMKKTYYYLYVNTRPRSQTDENANMAISVVVEDTCDSEGKPVYRTIYSLNNRGTELRKIDIENPTSKILNIIATSAKRNSQGQITETRSSEVHANIRDNESVAKFLNPYDAKTKSWDNDLATMQKDVGKINVMEYDRSQPPRLTATKVKFGSEGNEYFVSATDYNDDGLVVAEYGYPERTIERNDKSCSGTIYRYTYWNGNEKVIKTKETIEAAIPLSQNGPGVPAATQEYYDQDGHLRWQRNASGVVTYYGYHPVSGERALTVRDVDTNNLPHIVTAQNKNVTSWTGPSPFQRNPKLEKAFNQIDLVEFDAQGKQIGNVDQDGIRDVTLELPGKIIRFSRWSMAEKRLLSPISVEEYNVADNVTSSYTLPFSAVVTENGLPAGVNSAAKKLTWTKYNYDPVQGNLLHVDRYHSIPANGVGELGTHYYRSVSIYDPMGRVAATADFVKEGEWVVNAQKYDWRGRSVETLRAVAMNPPQYIDLADEGWLETVSKTFYDGERNAKMLMMTGTGENDYRGTKYCYDKESQLRGTVSFYNDNGKEIAFGPFSVNDYDWQGNVTATAVFAQEPNWKAVATNAHYARETADSRQNLTLSYYNNNGMLYRSEQFAGAEQKTPVVRQDIYVDIEGRTVATERTGDTATEMAYNAIGASYQTRVIVKLSQNKYENGEFLYNSPVPRANLSEHQGGSSGVLRISHNEFNEQGRPIATHQMDSTDLAGIDFAKNNFVRQTAFSWYDNKGNLVTQANYGSGDPEKGTGRWAYFPVLQRQTEPPQNLSEIVVVTKYYPELNVDNVDTNIDARGIVTKLFKDALGRSIRQVTNYVEGGKNDDENVTTSYEYNASGQVIAITDPLGNTSKREYDVHGRMVAEIDAEENKTQYLYDFEGKTIAVTDQLGRTTNFEHDKQGRRIKTILPAPVRDADRPVEQIVYDTLGRVSKNIDPLGNAKEFEYDNFGRIVTEIDAMGGLTKYTYDTAGRRTSLTDPVGNTTTFEYDILGRLVKETNSLEKSRFFEYVGTKPVKKTDRNGRVTEYIHDRFGRLKEEKWLDGDKVVKSLKYENNWDGTLKIIGDENFRYDYKYDKFGRPESSIFKPGELAAIETTTRYDNLNRRKVLEMQSEKTEYTYSPRGQVASIKRGNQSVSYKYDAANQRVAAITPVMATAYSYDGLGRLSDIQHGKMANYGYKWDLASRISAMNIAGETATYSYDKASQLTGADYATLPDEKYDYDLNGNRKNFVTGKNNQLLSDGENEYKYDDEGNRIAKGNIRYEWDHRNRLTKVITPEEIVAYSYDHLNRLVRRNNEVFVQDGWQIVKVLDLQGETKEKYFGGAKQDELVASNDNYVIADHLGTVRKVVDKDGNAVSELQYDAFGQLISATGEKPRFRYTGKMFDDVTELQWNVHRWYDARVGRWCSEDPVGFGAGDGNLNRYVGNAVVGKVDFLGQWGANVHNDKTWEWARKDVEYTYDAADMIAIWDEKVDGDAVSSIPLASGYLPIIGAQGYHFNRNRPNTDSRTLYKDEHYQNAIDYCVDGKPVDAAQHLGIALHPLQDYYAHGDYGIFDTLPNGGLWTTHNKYGPVLAGAAGEPWQYPDDISLDAVGGPRPAGAAIKTKIITILFFDQVVDYAVYKKGTQRFLQTKTASINLLTKFRTTIEAKTKTQKICTCIKYFFE